MSQIACRPTCVDRGAGAAAAVGSGRSLLDFLKPKSETDGAKEWSVLMDSSTGGGARGDADVVATGVVSTGEGGAGAGSDADVVVTGVLNGLEGCEGAGIDMDVFSPTLQTGVVPPIWRLSTLPSAARDYVRLSGSLFSNTTLQLSIVLATRGCRERLG